MDFCPSQLPYNDYWSPTASLDVELFFSLQRDNFSARSLLLASTYIGYRKVLQWLTNYQKNCDGIVALSRALSHINSALWDPNCVLSRNIQLRSILTRPRTTGKLIYFHRHTHPLILYYVSFLIISSHLKSSCAGRLLNRFCCIFSNKDTLFLWASLLWIWIV